MEIFECFNAVFRMCSIYSNHHAPSWDIAWQLADQEGTRQHLTGGYWQSGDDESWEQAGASVCGYLEEKPVLQQLYGWTDPAPTL